MARARLYNRNSKEPFRISRSGIEQFVRCPLCFVLKVKFGLKSLESIPFTLNTAVDTQLKKEYDSYRRSGTIPPLVAQFGLELIPFAHKDIDTWRDNFKGIEATTHGFTVFGAVDDIWVAKDAELVVVDYKATSRQKAVTELGTGGFYDAYRRQIEIYQWLLRKMGFKVSNTAYWLYATATKREPSFEGVLYFEQNLVSYQGEDSWIEPVLKEIKKALDSNHLPTSAADCDPCRYVRDRQKMGS